MDSLAVGYSEGRQQAVEDACHFSDSRGYPLLNLRRNIAQFSRNDDLSLQLVTGQFEILGTRRDRCTAPTTKRTTAANPNTNQASITHAVSSLAHIRSLRKSAPIKLSIDAPAQIAESLNTGMFTANYSVPPRQAVDFIVGKAPRNRTHLGYQLYGPSSIHYPLRLCPPSQAGVTSVLAACTIEEDAEYQGAIGWLPRSPCVFTRKAHPTVRLT